MTVGDDQQTGTMEGAAPVPGDVGRGAPGDEEIATALQDSDLRRAIELCAAYHGETIGRFCMSLLGSQADAQDVTQDTLIDAYRGLGSWRGEGSLRSWLMAIARRKCARLLEQRGRRRTKLQLASEAALLDPVLHAEQHLDAQQRAERARAALAEIRPSEREALVLRFGSGLSYREVGEALEIDEAAARKRVSRGIAALRRLLAQQHEQER